MYGLDDVVVLLILIILIIVAFVVALKLISLNEDQLRAKQAGQTTTAAAEGNFLESFLKPIYADGLDEMETAIDSLQNGLDLYGHKAYVDAGEEFIAAGHGMNTAVRKFREVMSLVEDSGNEYAKKSTAHIAECKQFHEMAKEMESACDAMLDDKEAEARTIAGRASGLKKMIDEWKKE